MKTFKYYNESRDTILDHDSGYSKVYSPMRPPEGFRELRQGYFVYMIEDRGKVIFISAGKNPWDVAEKLREKFGGDRVLYQPVTADAAGVAVEALIKRYRPLYNSETRSAQLTELDAILGT